MTLTEAQLYTLWYLMYTWCFSCTLGLCLLVDSEYFTSLLVWHLLVMFF